MILFLLLLLLEAQIKLIFVSRLIFSLLALFKSNPLSCLSFYLPCSRVFLLFPVEAEGLLFLSFVLLFPLLSSSLASLAMPSFLQPARTNLMGDKSVWLTVIKEDAGNCDDAMWDWQPCLLQLSNSKNLQAQQMGRHLHPSHVEDWFTVSLFWTLVKLVVLLQGRTTVKVPRRCLTFALNCESLESVLLFMMQH